MFTGIIEATAQIIEHSDDRITVERPKIFDDLKHGSSIAVSGVCLSVTTLNKKTISFDIVSTTKQKTKLGQLKTGDRVNLERALLATGRFEGHIVTGHCEGVGKITEVGALTISLPSQLLPFVIPQGSIAIDGVALTIAHLDDSALTVALIPITRQETTLGTLKIGDSVNLETDILGRYLLKAHEQR
jgi:riboflavin synthase